MKEKKLLCKPADDDGQVGMEDSAGAASLKAEIKQNCYLVNTRKGRAMNWGHRCRRRRRCQALSWSETWI